MTGVLARLRQKTATFLRQPPFIQAWFPAVWIILGISKGLIFTLSFRRPAPRLGRQSDIAPWVPLLTLAKERRALLIGRVVRMTARYTPWDANCFPQAIAARVLLGLYGVPYVLFFGLLRDVVTPTGLKAHAPRSPPVGCGSLAGPALASSPWSFDSLRRAWRACRQFERLALQPQDRRCGRERSRQIILIG